MAIQEAKLKLILSQGWTAKSLAELEDLTQLTSIKGVGESVAKQAVEWARDELSNTVKIDEIDDKISTDISVIEEETDIQTGMHEMIITESESGVDYDKIGIYVEYPEGKLVNKAESVSERVRRIRESLG